MTYRYIILAAVCAFVWVLNGRHIAEGVRKHITCEIYAHSGLGIFFTLLALEYVLGGTPVWAQDHIYWLRTLGFILYIPAAIFVFGAMIELHRKGRAGDSDALSSYGTTVVVESGVFRVVRHPMWLGMSIWSLAVIFISQSVPGIVLGVVAVILFRLASVRETELNIERLGAPYRDYAGRVPTWNLFRGLRR
ncbi:MAG: isoprenylcysteine carboxylmethyltransferase family protein [Dehalococcoidales bacterium]|nr:isoprenylcysteine carboxylmethyltransferase family protein [Dehalococcoidales bacterium]